MNEDVVDVVVVGGGAAGLSAAVVLGRARRSVVVVDAGAPRNAPAAGVHGFLTRDGMSPAELVATGREEVVRYGGEVVSCVATGARRVDGGFAVDLANGDAVLGRRLVVATGLVDELPDVPGLAQRWGRDVVHCPYCHGWEIRDRAIGVLGTGPMAAHSALLFRQWSDDVVLFRGAASELTAEQAEQLAARGITVVEDEVAGLEVHDDRLTGVRLRSGEVVARQALAVTSALRSQADVLRALGLETAPLEIMGHRFGDHAEADPTGATSIPGVWVAGNVTDPLAQVVMAAAAGVKAAAAVNADLIAEETAAAVAELRSRAAVAR